MLIVDLSLAIVVQHTPFKLHAFAYKIRSQGVVTTILSAVLTPVTGIKILIGPILGLDCLILAGKFP